jgi:hypothetical protein
MAQRDRTMDALEKTLRDMAANAPPGANAPAPDVVALKLDPRARTTAWVTLSHAVTQTQAPEATSLLGLLSAAASEMVNPLTYMVVQQQLGLACALSVAPYELKRSFRGVRVVLWTRDDTPTDMPAVRFSFDGAPEGNRWMGTCFVVAYPKRPRQLAAPVPVPGTMFAVREGDEQICTALNTRAALEAALADGSFGFEWVTQAEAASTAPAELRLSMNFTPTANGAVVMSTTETRMRLQCVVCNTACTKRCQRCQVESYCSRACQEIAWPAHKLVCKQKDAI